MELIFPSAPSEGMSKMRGVDAVENWRAMC